MRIDRHALRGCELGPALNAVGSRESSTSGTSANRREPPSLLSCPITSPSAPVLSQRPPFLTFDSDQVAYDADRHAVQFPACDGSRRIICEISLAALMCIAAAERPETKDESLIAIYRRLGAKIRKIAMWKYLAGALEPDGRILVATADLHGRCDQSPKTRHLSRKIGAASPATARATSKKINHHPIF